MKSRIEADLFQTFLVSSNSVTFMQICSDFFVVAYGLSFVCIEPIQGTFLELMVNWLWQGHLVIRV